MENPKSKVLHFIDLGLQSYQPIWDYQRQLQQARIAQKIPDTLLFVEHRPVYTIGKNGTDLHVIGTETYLKEKGIEVVNVDRGGDVTYHGPGQLVGYPIFDLNQHKKSISDFMRKLERVFINVLVKLNIESRRNDGYTGVWIGNEKITALGVRISRWVTMHGFAFNVNPSLAHFQGIIPCGIFQYGVTSLQQLLGKPQDMAKIKAMVLDEIVAVFGFTEVHHPENPFLAEVLSEAN